jgi:hypothetical protein
VAVPAQVPQVTALIITPATLTTDHDILRVTD